MGKYNQRLSEIQGIQMYLVWRDHPLCESVKEYVERYKDDRASSIVGLIVKLMEDLKELEEENQRLDSERIEWQDAAGQAESEIERLKKEVDELGHCY